MSGAAVDRGVFAELQATAGADFVAELVETFAAEVPSLLGDLRSALADGAPDRFRRAAHSVKSNGLAFGATRLAAQARELELGALPADARPLDALQATLEDAVAELRSLARG